MPAFSWNKVKVNVNEGIGVGVLFPKTNTKLLDYERYDEFHVSGWGVNGVVALNVNFFKYFFVQSEFKGGYINMPNIRTTQHTSDSASQDFFFTQLNRASSYSVLLAGVDRPMINWCWSRCFRIHLFFVSRFCS